jgi:hypothetical protein
MPTYEYEIEDRLLQAGLGGIHRSTHGETAKKYVAEKKRECKCDF